MEQKIKHRQNTGGPSHVGHRETEISCKIYVATNPYIQSSDGQNEPEKLFSVVNGRVKTDYEEESLRKTRKNLEFK